MIYPKNLPLLFFVASCCFAERSFTISSASKLYDVKLTVHGCDGDTCSGPGSVVLSLKNSAQPFEQFPSPDLYFLLDAKTKTPTANTVELYGEQSPVIFGDFNFDGSEDLAIRNGNHGGYDGPSYDIYVFNITRKKFVKSVDLTRLASENLGMFNIDEKRQRIITFNKDGCCWHLTTEYAVIAGKGLRKVRTVTEDARDDPDKLVVVTEKNLVGGVWKTSVKKYDAKKYYK